MSWFLRRRKKNLEKSNEALEFFFSKKKMSPQTRKRYLVTLTSFAEFLLKRRKNLLEANTEDVYDFLHGKITGTDKSIISSFYKYLISFDIYQGRNPTVDLKRVKELKLRGEKIPEFKPVKVKKFKISEPIVLDEEEKPVISDIEEVILSEFGSEEDKARIKPKEEAPKFKRLMSNQDFEDLLLKVSHIRDRMILELLWWTGIRPVELTNLLIEDIDLEKRRISIHFPERSERVIFMNKRLANIMKRYMKWRSKQIAPTEHLVITARSKEPLSVSGLSGFLLRLQKDKPKWEKWTTKDFRKRALVNYYYMTRDIVATSQFAGGNEDSVLKLIAKVMEERNVSTIDELGELTEFKDGYSPLPLKREVEKELTGEEKSDDTEDEKKKVKPRAQQITILLTPEEQELIQSLGLTPTSAVKSLLSFKELYKQLAPQGMVMAQPGGGGGYFPGSAAARASAAPPPSRGPSTPRKGPSLPKGPLPGPGGSGGGMGAVISELRNILKKRREKSKEAEASGEPAESTAQPEASPPPAGSTPPPITDDSTPSEDENKPKVPPIKKVDGANAPKFL